MKQTVLMIDDDIDDITLTKEAFQLIKADVKFSFVLKATNIIHYLDAYAGKDNIHLILLDLNMPGIDGKAVLKQLKNSSTYDTIPVVVFSTSTSETDREECLRLKANMFISKPGSLKHWELLVQSLCYLFLQDCLPS